MILHWMLYCTLVALLFGLAASSLERVVRQRGWQVRWLWAGAMAGSALLPAVAYLLDARRQALALSGVIPLSVEGDGGALWLSDPFAAMPEPAFDVGPWLLALWAVGSVAAVVALCASYATLRRRARSWAVRRVDGHEVWVAPDTGPAVVGFVRSRIVLPEWVLERSLPERRMVIAHEAEHLCAGDPRLLLATLLVAAAIPWNPAVWWQWRRLRHAVEVDCDLRVISRGMDARAYGRLLVEVTERGAARRLAVAALSESHSSLERRIKLMFSPKPNGWWIRAGAAAAIAAACVVVACTADIPSGPGGGPAVNATGASGSAAAEFSYEVAVLDRVPELSNKGEIGAIMERLYPRLLQDAGIGGTAVVQLVIQPDGTPDQGTIKVLESDRPELGEASIAAVRAFRFRPGQYKGENVRVSIQMPITWQPASVAAARAASRVEVLKSEAQAISRGVDLAAPSRPGDFAYEVAVLSRVPELQNKGEIGSIMERLYPRLLQDAGIGGTVVTQFVIAPDGTVDMASFRILESSNADLSAATRRAIEMFRFVPGQYKGENARTLIQMPVTWQPAG